MTLEHILDTIGAKFEKARLLWVFDRGSVSAARIISVGTPKNQLNAYEQKLRDGDWQ